MIRKFDCIGDKIIYDGFITIKPSKDGKFKEIIDEGQEYEETIAGDSLHELLQKYLKNYEERKMPESVLFLLKLAIEDTKE
jgi:hypothetical protein